MMSTATFPDDGKNLIILKETATAKSLFSKEVL